MPDDDLDLFIKCLGMLGSDHEGEAANARAMCNRLLKKHNLTWADVPRLQVAAGAENHHPSMGERDKQEKQAQEDAERAAEAEVIRAGRERAAAARRETAEQSKRKVREKEARAAAKNKAEKLLRRAAIAISIVAISVGVISRPAHTPARPPSKTTIRAPIDTAGATPASSTQATPGAQWDAPHFEYATPASPSPREQSHYGAEYEDPQDSATIATKQADLGCSAAALELREAGSSNTCAVLNRLAVNECVVTLIRDYMGQRAGGSFQASNYKRVMNGELEICSRSGGCVPRSIVKSITPCPNGIPIFTRN